MEFNREKSSSVEVSGEILNNSNIETNPEKIKEITIEDKTLVLLAGLSGSGKSTFAINNFPLDSIVSTDFLKQQITNNPGNMIMHEQAYALARKIIDSRLGQGKIVVVDAQNLTEGARRSLYEAARANSAKIVGIFLDVDVEESIERDKQRGKKVGASYIKSRKVDYATTRRLLERNPNIDQVYIIKPGEDFLVSLPEEYERERVADEELLKEAEVTKLFLTELEPNLKKREIKESTDRIPIKAGAVLFIEGDNSQERSEFLKNNFLPHQIVDAVVIAKRLAVDINDEAVFDVIKTILYNRIYLNLTTCVVYPPGFAFAGETKEMVKKSEERRKAEVTAPEIEISENNQSSKEIGQGDDVLRGRISINKSDLVNYLIDLRRDAPDNAPLFIIGDVHGAYMALRELASQVRQENLTKDADQSRRKIVFVGDMADRGPYSAETVIYIISLVRQGRAILVKGNHDENLLRGLRGEDIKSADTRQTIDDLKKRLKSESIQKIIEVLEAAPYYAEWKNLVVVHASLPRIPRKGEVMKEDKVKHERHIMTHGARSGQYTGGRAEVWKLHNTVAKDPDVLAVGGHTHEEEPVTNVLAGTTILDGNVEQKGKLWGMYYPEMELAFAQEPTLVALYKIMESGVMPEGNDLLVFVEYLEMQGLVEIKRGEDKYDGLTLVTYSGYTELTNAWEKYPILRNFRGLIVNSHGNVIARPFEKTHKAGSEIPLDKLEVIPDKVFEKANGSMGIVYFWNGKWRVATKFSFENEGYTKPSQDMLAKMNIDVLDQEFTYLFEIILPNDSHIVDYGGKQELILLNVINTKTGQIKEWEEVSDMAAKLGTKTAEDMTERFKGMTIVEIYKYAQQEGNLTNLEGLMAQYTDEDGKKVMVKVKTREYDDKKFVRDRLDWEKIIEAFDQKTMDVPPEKFEELLSYNFDNNFARAALYARIQWVKERFRDIIEQAWDFTFDAMARAELSYNQLSSVEGDQKAIQRAMKEASDMIDAKIKAGDAGLFQSKDSGSLKGFIRHVVRKDIDPDLELATYAIARISETIQEIRNKKGKNSFWVVPS